MAQIEEACTICGLGTPLCICGAEIGHGSTLPDGILATDNEADARQGLPLDLHAFVFDPFSATQGLPQEFGTVSFRDISTATPLFVLTRSQAPSQAFPSLDEYSASMCKGCAQGAPLNGPACPPSFDNDDVVFATEQRLNDRLVVRGLAKAQVVGDGNCQATAISVVLYGTPDRADEIRTQMVAHLVENRPRFENYLVLNPLTLGGLMTSTLMQ
jgi:hypothetical protein